MKHGKNYRNALARWDREELLSLTDAVEKVKTLSSAKFDETVELAIRLGVDPRRAEQIVRGTLSLPAGHRQDETASRSSPPAKRPRPARDAGADEVGAEDLVAKVAGGFLDFDVAIATPDLMGQVGGLRSSPRTAWSDAEPQDRHRPRWTSPRPSTEFKGGRVEYRH